MMARQRFAAARCAAPVGIVRPSRGERRDVSIWDALVWAFAVEKACLDFDEIGTVAGVRPGVGMEWILMERQRLGCSVDGGGHSDCHPDADLLASAVASLPEGCGGRRMAAWIADLARAARWPDPRLHPRPTCEPVAWMRNRHGDFARREEWRGTGMWPPSMLRKSSQFSDGYVCPVSYTDTAREIAAARRAWIQWRLALLDLRATFQIRRDLTAWTITDALPPVAPWKRNVDGA